MEDLKDYKTVLIVGNGFDKSIGLNTSYDDFMGSTIFRESTSNGSNTLINYLIYKKNKHNNWVDIEKELGEYARLIKDVSPGIPPGVINGKFSSELRKCFRMEYIDLCSILKKYLIDESSKNIGIEISYTNAYKLLWNLVQENRILYTINFNYTQAAEITIGGIYDPLRHPVRYIHGTLKDNSDIVFGVQDGLDLTRNNVFLYKSHSRHKDVRGIPEILDNAQKIIFFGYSLGETDHSYFDDFFNAQTKPNCKSKEFVFYYYKEESYDDMVCQLIKLTNNRLSYLSQYNNINFIDSSNPIALKK